MLADQVQGLFALGLGFAVAGLLASAYQLVTQRPAGFYQLHQPSRLASAAAVPLLLFAAPYIIMRNTLRAANEEGPSLLPVAVATAIAGCWSLMCGTVVVAALGAAGLA